MSLLNGSRSLARSVHAHLVKWYNFFVKRRLTACSDYSYTSDWTSLNFPVWQKVLNPYCGRPHLRMLEIGSFQGRSAVWFLQNVLTVPTATLTCIDPLDSLGQEPRFDHNIRLSGQAHQVAKLKGRSEDILPTLEPEHFDVVYVDGDHRALNVFFDGVLSWRLLKPEGLMIFDDYLWKTELLPSQRPQMGIDLFLELHRSEIDLVSKEYQVIVRKIHVPLKEGIR